MPTASIRFFYALAVSATVTPALSDPPPGPEAFLALAVGQTLVGHCDLRLAPDTVVVRGTLTAETLKAEQAAEQIEHQLTAIEAVAAAAGGTLVPLARTREIDPEAVSRLLAQGAGKPFRSVQSIEVLLPDESGLDRLIDRLLMLGMGAPVPISGRRSGTRPLVGYRVSEPGARIDAMHRACRRDALSRWCGQRVSEVNRDACEEALTGFARYLRDNGLSLQVDRPGRGMSGDRLARLGSTAERQPDEALDLPGPDPIEIHGQVLLQVKVPDL